MQGGLRSLRCFGLVSEWVAIPVPDSGIPREVVEKAKANIKDNTWKSSKRNDRFWELSGGR